MFLILSQELETSLVITHHKIYTLHAGYVALLELFSVLGNSSILFSQDTDTQK